MRSLIIRGVQEDTCSWWHCAVEVLMDFTQQLEEEKVLLVR